MNTRRMHVVTVILVLLALTSVLLAACARPGTASNSSGSSGGSSAGNVGGGGGGNGGGGNPTVQMIASNFAVSTITISKGQKLTLVDTVTVPHIIQNGSWVNGSAQPSKENGAPNVSANFSGANANDSQDIGPFDTAGTFKLYCTIHVNMNLTVTVK